MYESLSARSALARVEFSLASKWKAFSTTLTVICQPGHLGLWPSGPESRDMVIM